MKYRDIFLPSFSTVLIAGMIAFLSCAHQNRYSDDVDVPEEDVYSENDSGSSSPKAEDSSLSSNSDLESGSSLESSTEPQKEKDAFAELGDSDKSSSGADSLEQELESDESKNNLAQNNSTQSLESNSNSKEPSFEDELEGTGTSNPSNSGGELGASASAATIPSTSELDSKESSSSLVQPKTEELEAKDSISSQIEPLPSEMPQMDAKPRKTYRGVVGSRVPKIPAKAITKKGNKLNRFYFVRQGDTPKKVSTLIYGSTENAGKLSQWNGKNWTPGKILYYASPKNSKDSKMDSFYKENNISADEYTVERGDWLSKIASKKLGSPKSWTEIAVINGIKSPKGLEVGQKIAIYPKNLTVSPEEPVIAQAEPATRPPVAQAKPAEPPPAVEPPPVVQAEPEVPVAVAPKEPVKSSPVGFDIKKFIEQEAFAGLMGLAGFFLLLLLIIKKRKKTKALEDNDFDNGEDGFQAPTKLKRK